MDLVTRESQDRQQKRIQQLSRQSRIPVEKTSANANHAAVTSISRDCSLAKIRIFSVASGLSRVIPSIRD